MSRSDDSVFDEPQFRAARFKADRADPACDRYASATAAPLPVGQGVWDEPALSPALAGERPAHVQTYAGWLQAGRTRFGALKSWGLTFGLALVSGLWAVVGAVLSQVQHDSTGGLLLIVVFGPVAEEMMKASATLMTIEKWPYVFRSPLQIVFCCLAAALGFAALENVLYLQLYFPEPSATLIAWRWTVCVMFHVACSAIVSLGLVKIWRHTMTTGTSPRVSLGTPYFITAATVHGAYNFAAIAVNPLFAHL